MVLVYIMAIYKLGKMDTVKTFSSDRSGQVNLFGAVLVEIISKVYNLLNRRNSWIGSRLSLPNQSFKICFQMTVSMYLNL